MMVRISFDIIFNLIFVAGVKDMIEERFLFLRFRFFKIELHENLWHFFHIYSFILVIIDD